MESKHPKAIEAGRRAFVLRNKLGLSRQTLGNACGLSRHAIEDFEGGKQSTERTRYAIAGGLGIPDYEIDCREWHRWTTDPDELIARIRARDLHAQIVELMGSIRLGNLIVCNYWLSSHAKIERTALQLPALTAAVLNVAKFLPHLSVAECAEVGLLSGDLLGCYWSFQGPQEMLRWDSLRCLAKRCAAACRDRGDEAAHSAITSRLHYNAEGMEFWSTEELLLDAAQNALGCTHFALADRSLRYAALLDPIRFGSSPDDFVVQLLHQAQTNVQTGKLYLPRALPLLKEAEELLPQANLVTRAHYARVQALYWEKKGGPNARQLAQRYWYDSLELLQQAFGTRHYLFAATRCRIRKLDFGDLELRQTRDEDLTTLRNSKVQYTDIINITKLLAIDRGI